MKSPLEKTWFSTHSALASAKPSIPTRVALLVVHGMGVQKEGDMLSEIGNSLLSWVASWVEGHGGEVEVLPGNPNREGRCPTCDKSGGPLHVHAIWQLPGANTDPANDRFDVVVAESWWADLVRPPASS
jgi:hypothetical protein